MKKILAIALSAALILSATSVAFAVPGDGIVTGDGDTLYIDTDVLDIVLPTASMLDFTIDPQGLLGLDAGGKKLSELQGSGEIIPVGQVNVINESSYDVTLGVTLKARHNSSSHAATAITFFNSKAAFDSANGTQATEDNNNVLLYTAVSSEFISDTNSTTFVGLSDGFIFNATGINGVDQNKLSFVLPEAEYLVTPDVSPGDYLLTLVADTGSGVAFKLGGYVNTNADWSKYAEGINTIGLDAVFTAAKTTTSDIASAKPERAAVGMTNGADAYAVVSDLEFFAAPGFITGPGTTATALPSAVASSKGDSTNIEIPFYADGKTTKSLTVGGSFAFPQAEYVLSGNKLILKKDQPTYTLMATSNGTKNFILTLSDDSTYTFSVNVSN